MSPNDYAAAANSEWDETIDESFPASDPPANFTHAGPPARRPPPPSDERPAAPHEPERG